jgi:hypothetical protein
VVVPINSYTGTVGEICPSLTDGLSWPNKRIKVYAVCNSKMSAGTQSCFSDDDDSSYMDRLKQLNSLLVQQGVDQNVTLGAINRKLNWVIEHLA